MTMNNLKILIVEDEVFIAEHLMHIILKYYPFTIKQAYSIELAIDQIEDFQPDLVLLDIRLDKGVEGIQIAEMLQKTYFIPFIFITSFTDEQIMQQALTTKPLGFMSKPYKEADIKAIIQIAIDQIITKEKNWLVVRENAKTTKVELDKVLFLMSDVNYIHIHTESKKYLVRKSLDWFLINTQKPNFIRIHRSYVVNCNKITSFSIDTVKINQYELPVSRIHKPSLQNFFKK